MNQKRLSARIEWGILVFLLMVCAYLITLQYRWTGELAQAEAERLQASGEAQIQSFAREFDAELTDSCERLIPKAVDAPERNLPTTFLASYQQWQASGAHPIFHRIAIAEVEQQSLVLHLIDQSAKSISPSPWPQEWSALKTQLEGMTRGGRPPFAFGNGLLLEFPLMGSRRGKAGWIILELDRDYLVHHWLPRLQATHFNNSHHALSVRTVSEPREILWNTASDSPVGSGEIASAGINRSGRTGQWASLPTSNAGASWLAETWVRPDALEKLVGTSRLRNLVIGSLLAVLIFAAGVALFLYTRRIRLLAEAQMRFVATISHELRTPLTIICGAAHNLESNRVPPSSQADYASMIRRHGEQLSVLVDEILDFVKADAQPNPTPKEAFSAHEFLRLTVANAQQLPVIAECTVNARFAENLPEIRGDRQQLQRALFNLLQNAAIHGRQSGDAHEPLGKPAVIELTASQVEKSGQLFLQVTIGDAGPGIPPRELRRIFDVFYRGARATENQTRGSGIGLSVVKDIVAAHGGQITASNRSPCGAIFTLTLPAATL
jgi:signal transduction histidine kinase